MRRLCLFVFCFFLLNSMAYGFSFSDDEREQARDRAAQNRRIEKLLDVPCRDSLKDRKIAVLIAERHSGGKYSVTQSKYSTLFETINGRLRDLGLRTYNQEDITRQIADAEIRAYMNNDPDAALSAAKRLSANFMLRGVINSRTNVNPILHINEVSVDMSFTLTNSSGRTISGTTARMESYSGADTIRTAQILVEEQADQIVAKLYHDFCLKGGSK
jgi:hypothetical protein